MAEEQERRTQLEKFLVIARGANGLALNTLIEQLLEAPGIYAFGEFLDLPSIKELLRSSNSGYSLLLKIFAYGTYNDYKAFKDILPPLNGIQMNKLRLLSVVTLAGKYMQVIPYSVLMKDLELASVRQLDDLLIEAMYTDVIQGKLDPSKQQLIVDSCIARDVPSEGITGIINTLTEWSSACVMTLTTIEQQLDRLSACKDAHLKTIEETEAESLRLLQQLKLRRYPFESPTLTSKHQMSLGRIDIEQFLESTQDFDNPSTSHQSPSCSGPISRRGASIRQTRQSPGAPNCSQGSRKMPLQHNKMDD